MYQTITKSLTTLINFLIILYKLSGLEESYRNPDPNSSGNPLALAGGYFIDI